jgi:hypothetical protein
MIRKSRDQGNGPVEPLYCTPEQGCQMTGLGLSKFYQLMRTREVQAKKAGSRTLVSVASIKAYLHGLPDFQPIGRPSARARGV